MSDFFRLQKRIDELSAIGARDGAVTRLGLTAEEQAARDLVALWCAARGAQVRRDAAGNLFARFAGERESDPVVLVGSHVDSVPDGGRFDGALGVVCAVEAIESLLDVGTRFQRPVEVVAWADEEGARFGIGLFGAAEMALALETAARSRENTVGTVGEIGVRPGAKNVVPGECVFTIDVRAPEQSRIDAVMTDFRDAVKRVSEARGLETSIDLFNAIPPTPLDLTMRDLFARAAASVGVEAPVLSSGAGHDAQNSALAGFPTGMLFIRSTGGSHTPRESAATVDAALASDALAFALRRLAG